MGNCNLHGPGPALKSWDMLFILLRMSRNHISPSSSEGSAILRPFCADTSEPKPIFTVGLAHERNMLKKLDIIKRLRKILLASRKKSSLIVYWCVWECFSQWCTVRKLSPKISGIPFVLCVFLGGFFSFPLRFRPLFSVGGWTGGFSMGSHLLALLFYPLLLEDFPCTSLELEFSPSVPLSFSLLAPFIYFPLAS